MKEEPEDLRTRTRRFALSAIRVSQAIARGEEGTILRRQFLRSATSIGAQYREACRARSDAEFISKLESASQEIDETLYWLELLEESRLCNGELLKPLTQEADELMRIFVTIVRKRKGL